MTDPVTLAAELVEGPSFIEAVIEGPELAADLVEGVMLSGDVGDD